MEAFTERVRQVGELLDRADCLVIGGGSGLSSAAGLDYAGPRFTDNFSDFIEKYGLTDMYSASFYPFPTQEELWAHWARHIYLNRFQPPAMPLYRDLLELAAGKPYFVITTNVEGQFEKAGFDPARLFEVQGNYAYLQCASACHKGRYFNQSLMMRMLEQTKDCKIPSSLVPKCPVCGGNMDVNLRKNDSFVEDESWHTARTRFDAFLQSWGGKRMVLLELGVGFNTPGIIRYPFEHMILRNKQAALIRVNRDYPEGIGENRERTVPFSEDMGVVIGALLGVKAEIGRGKA